MANNSRFSSIWGMWFIALYILPVCLVKYNPVFTTHLALTSSAPQGTAPSADNLGHSLHENRVNWVFGKEVHVNYLFPGFLTTAAITPYCQAPGALKGEHFSLSALAFAKVYFHIFLSLRQTTLPIGAHSWSILNNCWLNLLITLTLNIYYVPDNVVIFSCGQRDPYPF